MNPSPFLPTLHRTSRRRLARLREVVEFAIPDDHRDGQRARLAFCTIELANRWAMFCRSYYLSAALGSRNARGMPVRCSVGKLSLNDALGRAIRKHRSTATPKSDGSWPRRLEPTWHDPHVLIDLMSDVGSTNAADVAHAFSTGTRAFLDLPVFRNFFAHRNVGSMNAAQRIGIHYGIPSSLPPCDILLRRPVGRPRALLLDWFDDVQFTMEYLCT